MPSCKYVGDCMKQKSDGARYFEEKNVFGMCRAMEECNGGGEDCGALTLPKGPPGQVAPVRSHQQRCKDRA